MAKWNDQRSLKHFVELVPATAMTSQMPQLISVRGRLDMEMVLSGL